MSWMGTEVALTTVERGVLICRRPLGPPRLSLGSNGLDDVERRTRRMPGMVPKTDSMSPANSVTTVSRCVNRSLSIPTTPASSGDTSCRDRVALGSSLASSIAAPLSRSVRKRSAEADSEREGSDESSMPTACSSPETAPEIPSAAKSMPEPALLTPPSSRSSSVVSRSNRSATSLMASSVASADEGSRSTAPGKPITVLSNDGDLHTLIMGRMGAGVQFLSPSHRGSRPESSSAVVIAPATAALPSARWPIRGRRRPASEHRGGGCCARAVLGRAILNRCFETMFDSMSVEICAATRLL